MPEDKCSTKDCAKCWCLDCKGYTPDIRERHEIVRLKYLIAEEQYRAIDKSLKPESVQSCHDLIEVYKDKLKELGVKNV
jgi:hypothetical protein